MKKYLLLAMTLSCVITYGQSAGDIAFVGYNTDGLKAFSIVALSDIDGSSTAKVIYFTDDDWNGTAFAGGEGTITWTISTLITAGTVVDFTDVSGSVAVSVGTASETNAFNPINGSDAVYSYVGSLGTPTTFLAAITNDDFTNDTFLLTGTGLIVNTDAIELDAIDTDADIAEYIGTRIGTRSTLLSAINSTSNWITQDASGDQSIDGTEPDVPFNDEPFIVSSGNTITWDGSAADNDWANGNNWDGDVIPTAADNVILADVANDPIISNGVEAACYDLTINTGSILSIDTGGSLAIFGSVTNNGTCFVEKGLGDNGYSIIGSPVTSETIDALSVDHFYSHSNGSGFSGNLNTSTEVMAPGKGYFAAFDGTTTYPVFEGTPNAGDITYTVTNTTGFELVANPYTAAIRTSSFLSDNSTIITGGVYFWDDGGSNVAGNRGGDYITVTAMGTASAVQPDGTDDGVGGTNGVTGADNGFIPSVQGVFVEVQASGNISFTPDQLTSADGSNSDGNYYRKTAYQKVKLAIIGNGLYNEILIGLGEDATYERDGHLDAKKFATDNPLSFYSLIDEEKYVIQGLPLATFEAVATPLGFDLAEAGTFMMKVVELENIPENLNVTLIDHLTSQTYDLRNMESFEFTTGIAENDQRFELVFSPVEVLSVGDISNGVKIYGDKDKLTIQSNLNGQQEVSIYTLDGKTTFKEAVNFSNNKVTINPSLTQNKVYVMRLGEQSIQFIIK